MEDKNPLFNNFDYENSLFNKVTLTTKTNQNSRIYVNDQGEQNKNKVQYQHLVSSTAL